MLQHVDMFIAFAALMLLLSLLVTTLVQSVSALAKLRSKNLVWAIEQFLGNMAPELASKAEMIAKKVVSDPSLSPGGKGGETATIKPAELETVLHRLADDGSKPTPGEPSPGAAKPEGSTDREQSTWLALKRVLEEQPKRAVLEVKQASDSLTAELAKVLPDQANTIREAVDSALAGIDTAKNELQTWFSDAMDRATERFVRNTKWVSFFCALAVAFVLQVDALSLLKQLSTDSEMRATLVGAADATLKRAEEVFTHEDANREIPRKALVAVAEAQEDDSLKPPADAVLRTRGDGARWLKGKVEDAEIQTELVTLYGQEVEEQTLKLLSDLGEDAASIRRDLEAVSIPFAPPSPFWKNFGSFWHWIGILITTVLLSLGAPFWFNALRQMSNLRPVIAEKLDPKGRAARAA